MYYLELLWRFVRFRVVFARVNFKAYVVLFIINDKAGLSADKCPYSNANISR